MKTTKATIRAAFKAKNIKSEKTWHTEIPEDCGIWELLAREPLLNTPDFEQMRAAQDFELVITVITEEG
jgi:hypothetical protein